MDQAADTPGQRLSEFLAFAAKARSSAQQRRAAAQRLVEQAEAARVVAVQARQRLHECGPRGPEHPEVPLPARP